MKSKKTIILYHDGCSDGFGAAWAAWKKFGTEAEYVPVYHSDDPKLNYRDKDVYFVDICLPPAVIKKIMAAAKTLTIIDHHKSNRERVKLATRAVYDLKHSGAILTWNFFHPAEPAPLLLRHIEDVDIWKWKLAHTDELMEYLTLVPIKFSAWNQLASELENPVAKRQIIEKGKLLVLDRTVRVQKLIQHGEEGSISGHKAFIVNSPVTVDQTANLIYQKMKYPIAIIWSRRKGKYTVSLRSNTVDVSLIAEKFGGGGHRSSAAFSLPASDSHTLLSFYK